MASLFNWFNRSKTPSSEGQWASCPSLQGPLPAVPISDAKFDWCQNTGSRPGVKGTIKPSFENCAVLFAWSSVFPPRESRYRCGSLGPLLLTLAYTPTQKEHFVLTAVVVPDCILPGLVLAFVPAPFRVQGFEGEAVVCIPSSSYLPKWCDVSTKSTAPEGDHICSKASLLHIDCALWTNDLDSLCLGLYPFKMGIVIETNSWGCCDDSIKIQ